MGISYCWYESLQKLKFSGELPLKEFQDFLASRGLPPADTAKIMAGEKLINHSVKDGNTTYILGPKGPAAIEEWESRAEECEIGRRAEERAVRAEQRAENAERESAAARKQARTANWIAGASAVATLLWSIISHFALP